jgi:hypothetical protein
LPGVLNRKFEHEPHCHEICSPTRWQMIKSSSV